ncbi:hypothetical protein ACSS6W_003171 [Trichoderma asperelloides]
MSRLRFLRPLFAKASLRLSLPLSLSSCSLFLSSSPAVELANNFLTCISSPFEAARPPAHHPPLVPPSPASAGLLGPFRGNCGLGCFINRAVRVGLCCSRCAGAGTP